jgi:hypothetical protein
LSLKDEENKVPRNVVVRLPIFQESRTLSHAAAENRIAQEGGLQSISMRDSVMQNRQLCNEHRVKDIDEDSKHKK